MYIYLVYVLVRVDTFLCGVNFSHQSFGKVAAAPSLAPILLGVSALCFTIRAQRNQFVVSAAAVVVLVVVSLPNPFAGMSNLILFARRATQSPHDERTKVFGTTNSLTCAPIF